MTRALDVTGALQATIGSHTLEVRGQHEDLHIDLPDRDAGKALARLLPSRSALGSWLRSTHRALNQADVQLQIRLDQQPLLRLGARTSPGWLSKLLGFGPAEARVFSILRLLYF